MKKVFVAFGTRPEAIKMAPVLKEINKSSTLKSIICVSAQHREMLDQVLKVFDIHPDYDLNIMKSQQDLFDITESCLTKFRTIISKEKPDLVLVQGDTTTAFVAGFVAFYLKIPIGHVEAGLRTHNKYSPFPEEINRHLLSVVADYHFAPTDWAESNLIKENIPKKKIWVTGNTVIDALLSIVNKNSKKESSEAIEKYYKERWNLSLDSCESKIILVTGHRRENFGEKFENICFALKDIAAKRKDIKIVYPVHLNPNVQKPVKSILKDSSNIFLVAPLEYERFVYLISKSHLVLTDSGGIQEEAPSLGKPVLVLRDTTERPEGLTAGVVRLVGTEKENIINNTLDLLDNKKLYKKMSTAANPYGDGLAGRRIVEIMSEEIATAQVDL